MKFVAREIDGGTSGIGHKLWNWLAGYSVAKKFGLNYAHISLNNESQFNYEFSWEDFFGINANEISYDILLYLGYNVIKLKKLNLNKKNDIDWFLDFINNSDENTIFILNKENDWLEDHYEYSKYLKRKYYASPYRNIIKSTYNVDYTNIAVHIRRGDIIPGHKYYNKVYDGMYSPLHSYLNVMDKILELNYHTKPIMFHIYSENNIEDLNVFRKYDNININLSNNMMQIFTNLVESNILIGSNHSNFFQYAGLLNNNIVLNIYNQEHNENWISIYDINHFNSEKYRNEIHNKKL
jgi:hypothetical protein